MAALDASSRLAVGTSYVSSSSRNNLAEIHPPNNSSMIDDHHYTARRIPHYPSSSHRPSMISNLSCNLTNNPAGSTRSRSHSKADSISTLWSSAEVPLFLDTSMERTESSGSHSNSNGTSKMFSNLTPMRSSSNGFQGIADDCDEREELSNVSIINDGPRSVSSPRSSDIGEFGATRRESHRQQMRPPPLDLYRDTTTSNVPASVSLSSSDMVIPIRNNQSNVDETKKQLPPSPPSYLYQEAEKFFSLSYTMTPPPSADSSAPSFENSQSTEESQQSPVNALSPSYSYSRDSRSSTDSSSVLPEADSYTDRLCAIPTMTKSVSHDGSPSSPLRVAFGLTAERAISRPHTSLATLTAGSPRTKSPANLHTHTIHNQEPLRQSKDGEEIKYSFLDSPAPSISGRKSSVSSRKMSLLSAKLRTSSTPKLRADKMTDNIDGQDVEKEQREASRVYPPQAPSGRFRARTLGESELSEPLQDVNMNVSRTPRTSQDSTNQRQPRRPSSSDPLSVMAARLRRPSKALTISSSHYNSSVASISNVNEVYEVGPPRVDRAFSTTSSQFFVDSANNRSSSMSTFLKKTSSSAPVQTKSKGGWASHLTQGLTLHIEQGSKRYVIRMNYLSYDPFGKPESLCKDRPVTPSRPKSKSGVQQEDETLGNDSVGLLEFDPRIETEGSTSADRLTLDATADAPILKHLVIGNDVKGDLITRQANLSLCNIGAREVSGSERKGKVTWRFIYGVEDCRLDSGEIVTGMKTLRPLSFTCSATLLDPCRAKKSRMMNIIRKQIGSNIESMPMPEGRNASITSSTYLQSLPALPSPNSSHNSSQQGSPIRSTYSPVNSLNPTHSPTKTGLTPFKLTRPMMEALAARNRLSSEISSSTSLPPSSPRGTSSFLTRKSSLLPSPLSSKFQVDRSPPLHYAAGGRLLAPHQIKTRPRGASVGKESKSALGLDVGDGASTPRRIRPSTSQGELKRPTTASEEIKQAYLMQSSLQNLDSLPTSPTYAPHKYNFSNHEDRSPMESHPQYSIHRQSSHKLRRPSNTNYTSTTITSSTIQPQSSKQQPVSPVVPNKQKRQGQTDIVSTTAGPPEGPFWL